MLAEVKRVEHPSVFLLTEQPQREPEEEQRQTQVGFPHSEEEIQNHRGGESQTSNLSRSHNKHQADAHDPTLAQAL